MSTELPPSLTAAMPLLDRLHLAVWFFDMRRQSIVWANRQALQLWDAADLASLQERDFSISSEALRTRFAVYQAAFAEQRAVEENWTLYPHGLPLQVRCHCARFDNDWPELMKVEAVPVSVDADTVRSVEMLRHVREMVSLYDDNGVVLQRNPAAALALPPSEGDALLASLPDPKLLAELRLAAMESRGVRRVVDVRLADGSMVRHQVQLFRIRDPATGESAMLISQHDVSDREKLLQLQRERSEELQGILDALPLPMVISELASERIRYANRLAIERYGMWLGSSSEFTPTSAALYEHAAERKRFLEILQQEGRVIDFHAVLRDREQRPFDASLTGCLIDYRGIPCVLASILDISHILQREHALEATLQHERELAEMQRRFVSMVSHEYRTPLAVIDGIAQRLQRQPEQFHGEQLQSRAQRLRDMVKHMVSLADSVLTLTRLEEGQLVVQQGPVRLVPLLAELVEQSQDIHPDCQIEVSFAADDVLIVDGDAELLRVVFGNLISNAIKYSPRWQRLALHCTVAGREVHVTVQDWGVGIPADEQDKLFTRFFRASTALGIPGSGMGLALVRELVQRHGGSITVDSSEDEGTRFTVRLPLLPALDERH